MGQITWVEDAKTYVKDMIDQLEDLQHTVRQIGDCRIG